MALACAARTFTAGLAWITEASRRRTQSDTAASTDPLALCRCSLCNCHMVMGALLLAAYVAQPQARALSSMTDEGVIGNQYRTEGARLDRRRRDVHDPRPGTRSPSLFLLFTNLSLLDHVAVFLIQTNVSLWTNIPDIATLPWRLLLRHRSHEGVMMLITIFAGDQSSKGRQRIWAFVRRSGRA